MAISNAAAVVSSCCCCCCWLARGWALCCLLMHTAAQSPCHVTAWSGLSDAQCLKLPRRRTPSLLPFALNCCCCCCLAAGSHLQAQCYPATIQGRDSMNCFMNTKTQNMICWRRIQLLLFALCCCSAAPALATILCASLAAFECSAEACVLEPLQAMCELGCCKTLIPFQDLP